jgi:hypothetical protein
MLDHIRTLPPALAATIAFAAGAAAPAGAASAPKIHAKPRKLMVNTDTTLKGAGFAPDERLQIGECGRTFWLAPSTPCLEEDVVEVTTNAKGRFETAFRAGVCPEGERKGGRTEVVCYVGALSFGEDSGELVGAAKILVSYP